MKKAEHQERATLRPIRRWTAGLTAGLVAGSLLVGCSVQSEDANGKADNSQQQKAAKKIDRGSAKLPGAADGSDSKKEEIDEQPSTVYYEVFVRSFYDSDGDGIGDLKGLTEKLDYLNDGNPDTTDDLGVGGIWLMPIQPSPSYHGYDVTDYTEVNPDYGSLDDLRNLVAEAHKRGMKVIMDLVVNHTSSEHPWFIDSSSGKESPYRDWYVWAEDQGMKPAGVSAAGSGNPWVERNGSHYLGTFWSEMPDLNYDNPNVRSEIENSGQFWLKQGIDGFRIDGAKHIYENLQSDRGEKTTAKNVSWWQEFRSKMNEVNPNAYIVGEIWENSAAAIGPYLDNAFDSGFNFSLADLILSAAKNEQDNNLAFTLERTYPFYAQKSQNKFVDATFLSNHDQDRVMSQLSGNEKHAKMAAALLLTLPGNPFIYYGEEIGMQGVKPDERIREPFAWGDSAETPGQTTWEEPLPTVSGEERANVKSESGQGSSLLTAYRTFIRWRSELPALRDGNIESVNSGVPSVMAFLRNSTQQSVLVLHNLSGKEQQIRLEQDAFSMFREIVKTSNDKVFIENDLLILPAYTTVILGKIA